MRTVDTMIGLGDNEIRRIVDEEEYDLIPENLDEIDEISGNVRNFVKQCFTKYDTSAVGSERDGSRLHLKCYDVIDPYELEEDEDVPEGTRTTLKGIDSVELQFGGDESKSIMDDINAYRGFVKKCMSHDGQVQLANWKQINTQGKTVWKGIQVQCLKEVPVGASETEELSSLEREVTEEEVGFRDEEEES